MDFFRAILLENKLDTKDWPDILSVVQMAFNHSPVVSLGGYAPVTVFTGIAHSSPIQAFIDPRTKERIDVSLPSNYGKFVLELQLLLKHRSARVPGTSSSQA